MQCVDTTDAMPSSAMEINISPLEQMKNNWFNSHELLWNMVQFHFADCMLEFTSLFIIIVYELLLYIERMMSWRRHERVGNSLSVFCTIFLATLKNIKFNIFTAWYWSITVKNPSGPPWRVWKSQGLCFPFFQNTKKSFRSTSQDS